VTCIGSDERRNIFAHGCSKYALVQKTAGGTEQCSIIMTCTLTPRAGASLHRENNKFSDFVHMTAPN
jgi:hypothetical protein